MSCSEFGALCTSAPLPHTPLLGLCGRSLKWPGELGDVHGAARPHCCVLNSAREGKVGDDTLKKGETCREHNCAASPTMRSIGPTER